MSKVIQGCKLYYDDENIIMVTNNQLITSFGLMSDIKLNESNTF